MARFNDKQQMSGAIYLIFHFGNWRTRANLISVGFVPQWGGSTPLGKIFFSPTKLKILQPSLKLTSQKLHKDFFQKNLVQCVPLHIKTTRKFVSEPTKESTRVRTPRKQLLSAQDAKYSRGARYFEILARNQGIGQKQL